MTVDGTATTEFKVDERERLTWVRFPNAARPRHVEVRF